MRIKYYGQSCFGLTSANGTTIITDPYGSGIGLSVPELSAEIVTVSHGHFDHNNLSAVKAGFACFDKPGIFENSGVSVEGFASFHDDCRGKKRGANVIFFFVIDGLRICHLGDLGHVPDKKLLGAIGKPDVMMIPVGEVYTFSAEDAAETAKLIASRVVIPMHYKLPGLKAGLNGPEKFLALAGGGEKTGSDVFDIDESDDKNGIVVLEPKR